MRPPKTRLSEDGTRRLDLEFVAVHIAATPGPWGRGTQHWARRTTLEHIGFRLDHSLRTGAERVDVRVNQ